MSQALSLRCGTCGVQLKSVAEAQLHSETTGDESTEAVLNRACTEMDMLQIFRCASFVRAGHSNFEESTEAMLNLTCTGTYLLHWIIACFCRLNLDVAFTHVSGAFNLFCTSTRAQHGWRHSLPGPFARIAGALMIQLIHWNTECGKPCRSQMDVDLHMKRTGHKGPFVDKVCHSPLQH